MAEYLILNLNRIDENVNVEAKSCVLKNAV